jgi:integrase
MRNCKILLFTRGGALLDKPVASITSDMIEAALADLWSRTPLQGRRALEKFAQVLDYAKAKNMRQGDNPAAWSGCFEYRFSKVKKTERGHFHALSYEALPDFMQQLRQRQGRGVGSVALEFTILTAVRTNEALGAQWSEIDWAKQTWTVPKERTKQNREHVVPLSKRAMQILHRQRECSQGTAFVFEGYGRKRMEERALRSVLKYMGVKTTVHGMRSVFRDWCGDQTNFAREHVEACLAHRIGSAVEQAYRRLDALEKRREILEAWAGHCQGTGNPT